MLFLLTVLPASRPRTHFMLVILYASLPTKNDCFSAIVLTFPWYADDESPGIDRFNTHDIYEAEAGYELM